MPIYPNTQPDPLIPTVSWVRGIFTELDNMIVGTSTLGSKIQDPLIPSTAWVRLLYYNILSKISCPSTYGGNMIDPLIPSTEWVRALYYDLRNRIENCNEPPVESPLLLTFDAIGNVPVADPTSLADWNTFFDLPNNGTPFTSVEVVGNEVKLYGGAGITIAPALFTNNANLISFIDSALCIVAVGQLGLSGCVLLTTITLNSCLTFGDNACDQNTALITFNANVATDFGTGCFDTNTFLDTLTIPSAVNIGDQCFNNCVTLSVVNIPLCQQLGSTVGDNNVFLGSGMVNPISNLTVPVALQTCNAGNPDGDIQAIGATIIYV